MSFPNPLRRRCAGGAVLALALTACGGTSPSETAQAAENPEATESAVPSQLAAGTSTGVDVFETVPRTPPSEAERDERPVEGPAVRAEENVRDFGRAYAGAQLEHTFRLDVVGTEDLVIEKIKPGCGCTVARTMVVDEAGERTPYVERSPLTPGTKLELLVRFDTSGKRGAQAKSVNVYCNDPRGVERLTMKVDLEEFLNTMPNTVALGRLSVAEERSGEAVMTTRGSGPVKLSVDPRRLPAELAVELTPKKPDAQGRATSWTVGVKLGGDTMRHGPYQFRIPVYSDVENPHAPENPRADQRWLGGSVLVTADVVDVYSYSPRQLFFGPVPPETAASRGFAFNAFDDEYPLEELEVSVVGPDGSALADAERYHTTVTPGNVEGAWRVELMVDGLPASAGLFEGSVRVATRNPDRPHIDIPFKGVVR